MNYKLELSKEDIPTFIKNEHTVIFSDFISPNLFSSGCNLNYKEILIDIYTNKDSINNFHKQLTKPLLTHISNKYLKYSKKKISNVSETILEWIEILLNITIEKDILILFNNNDINNAIYLIANYSKIKPVIKINDFNNNFNNYCNKIITTVQKQKIIIGTSGIENDERMQLKYIISQFYIMLNCLDNNGTFIFKVGGLYTPIVLKIIKLCNNIFKDISIVNPTVNDILNLQYYIICTKYDKNKGNKLIKIFQEIIKIIDKNQYIIDILDNYNLSTEYLKIIHTINNDLYNSQYDKLKNIKNINKTKINIDNDNQLFVNNWIKNIKL